MKRNSIGIDIVSEYYDMVKSKLKPVELILLEPPRPKYEKIKPQRRYVVR